MLVVCNFTPVPRVGYMVGVPEGGYWKELLNSDAHEYGGSGVGQYGRRRGPPGEDSRAAVFAAADAAAAGGAVSEKSVTIGVCGGPQFSDSAQMYNSGLVSLRQG